MKKRVFIGLIALVALLACQIALAATVTLTGATATCNVNGKTYVVQNNVWGASTAQTVTVDDQTGAFTVTRSDHNNPTSGSPASYPSIYKGSHWGNATVNSGMPVMVGNIGSVNSSWSITAASGSYNCAYDIWFNTTSSTSGQPNGAELMIWINHSGPPQPAGSKVATVTINGASWDVWFSQMSWKYIAYVRTSVTNSVNMDLKPFIADCVSRGYIQTGWYLIAVEAGFEIWQGGVGLASNSFSVTVTGGGSINTPTPTRRLATPTPTRRQAAPTPTPRSGGAGYAVSYVIQSDWGVGATVNVTVKNNTSAAVNGWTLAWTFPGNQTITNLWNGTYTQSGASVSVRDAGFNANIPANGGSVNFGFNLNYSGSNAKPASFTLNGTACAVQ
ncbi:MAG: cellulose binding domain-containing protein [Firmicutes bacterium]|nr:cellulose binding domain-containing protein [Bacillota bacterium]